MRSTLAPPENYGYFVPKTRKLTKLRKQKMVVQNRELEELQARIRAAEERLQSRGSGMMAGNNRPNAQKNVGYQSAGISSSAGPCDFDELLLTGRLHDRICISNDLPHGHGRPVLQ